MRYVLWALPKGKKDPIYERILLSSATKADIAKIKKLATKDGWHSFRVMPLDGKKPDFVGAIR